MLIASRNPFNRNGLRIFGASFLLMMTVMVYGYSGLLISCLTVPTYTKPIDTLEELAASKDVILYITQDKMSLGGFSKAVLVHNSTQPNDYLNFIKNELNSQQEGETGVWKELREQLERHPDGIYPPRPLTEKDFSPEHQNYATPVVSVQLISILLQSFDSFFYNFSSASGQNG